jgi:hypothetical protein
MIKEDILKGIEKTLMLAEGTLANAVKSEEEVVIKIPKLVVRTEEDFNAYETNIKNAEYTKGRNAGYEMSIKEAREKYQLEFQGKTLENFAEAFKTKVLEEAKVEPNQKITELSKDNETLKKNVIEWEGKYNSLKGEIEMKDFNNEVNSIIMSAIPDNVSLPKRDIEVLFKANYKIEKEEDRLIVKQNGEVIKNKTTLDPKPLKDVLNDFILERDFVKKAPGRGSSGSGGNQTSGTYEAFVVEMKEKGVNESSANFQQEMNKRIKDGTLKL